MSLISFGSGSKDYIINADILIRMRNECLIDYQALELNKRRLLAQPEQGIGKRKD